MFKEREKRNGKRKLGFGLQEKTLSRIPLWFLLFYTLYFYTHGGKIKVSL